MLQFLKHNLHLCIIFITGAAVLILEVTATRLLSPYFGNTIYTVSSVISSILLALSIGYYTGGRLADRKATSYLFYLLIALSGVSVLLIYLLNLFIIPSIAYYFSISSGPLISALLLFLLPNMLLGMLSPFVAALQKKRQQSGTGRITGDVFFWSTLGSIAGSLLCGFYLIPTYGVDTIIIATGIVLFILGCSGVLWSDNKPHNAKKILIALLILLSLQLTLLNSYTSTASVTSLYRKDGTYEKLSIFDGTYAGKRTRFFMQDRSNSGAMFLDSSDLVYDYTKYFQIYKLVNTHISHVLFIGGGAYSMPKALLVDNSHVNIDVTEIEPSLYTLGKQYFRVPTTNRLVNHVEDGRRFLHDSQLSYDMIFSDVYFSLFSIPQHFTTKEFFALSKSRLSKNGIFAANLIGTLSRASPSFLFSEIRTFKTVFPNSYFFAVNSPKSLYPQNIIFVGINGSKQLDFSKSGNNVFLQSVRNKQIDLERFDLTMYPIFIDNYAPVEFTIAKTVREAFNQIASTFNGEEAMALIRQQLNFGPRFLSSPGHQREIHFLKHELAALTEEVIIQHVAHSSADGSKIMLTNIIGRINKDAKQRIIIATHFDTQRYSHNDPSQPQLTVPGADNNASGVAVLLQLAQLLSDSPHPLMVGIDLVFFDGEEGEENLQKTQWHPLGSTYFANHIKDIYHNSLPSQAIVLDMVCNKHLQLYKEINSIKDAPQLVQKFWQIAHAVSPSFIQKPKYQIYDDHTPLEQAGIPSLLVIDYDYPFYDSPEDTIDKCSQTSLKDVGAAVFQYIQKLSL